MFLLALFYRFLSAAVGLQTGAGKTWRKHANSKLSILVLLNCFPQRKILILFLSGLSTEHDDSDESDDEHEIEWSRGRYQFSEGGEEALECEVSSDSSASDDSSDSSIEIRIPRLK